MGTSREDYPVIAVAGPTASGKSELALFLAGAFGGEIVNYDSVQMFRHLDIGSAKPSLADRHRVPHHLIDVLDPREVFSAGDYQRCARRVLEEIRSRGRVPILVGGTGLYLRAVLEGLFEGPPRSQHWRVRLSALARDRGPEHLHTLLLRLDPPTAHRIAPKDTPKIIRALEVRLETGRPLSQHLDERPRNPLEGFGAVIVGLSPPREALAQRIADRVSIMFDSGLVDEVRGLLEMGVPPQSAGLRVIGYRQVVEHILRGISRDEAVSSTVRDTRKYAKRQMTWFRRQHRVTWFDGFGNHEENRQRIRHFVHHFLGGFPDGS